jgi:alkylation response protein AidB-like acyl-CoA dehydrogenase
MFTEALEDILRDRCTPAVVRAIEAGGDPTPLWKAVADAGFLELLSAEQDGGAELPLEELFPIVAALGRHAVPLPVAQSIAARALLPAGQAPAGLVTLAPAVRRTMGVWQCPQVPYGTIATHVLADDGTDLLLFDTARAERLVAGVHRSQSATLRFGDADGPQRYPRQPEAQEAFGAALHAALIAGAMGRAFDMALQYGNDRVQFGRAIGKFQAVQHQLAVMAEQVAASRIAAEAAFRTGGTAPRRLAAAIAKARTSEAVTQVAEIAHAVHGAIGVTQEYDLQLLTKRLHEWRIAHGSEAHWHRMVGEAFILKPLPFVDFIRAAAA